MKWMRQLWFRLKCAKNVFIAARAWCPDNGAPFASGYVKLLSTEVDDICARHHQECQAKYSEGVTIECGECGATWRPNWREIILTGEQLFPCPVCGIEYELKDILGEDPS